MSECPDYAEAQYVWVDPNNGRYHISPPLCEAHSEDGQPAETVTVLPLDFDELPCEGPFDPFRDEMTGR